MKRLRYTIRNGFGTTKPVIVPIPLKADYAGKELTLAVTNGKYGCSMVHTAYFGTKMGIFQVIRVLAVDDTAVNLKVISKFLAKSGAEVTCAQSGEEMLELIQKNYYDVILLDHMMPNMDGIEALKASKEMPGNLCKDVPVIALTANAIVGAREMYLEAGFDDYLSKPVKMDSLNDMIAKYVTCKK